MVIFGLNSQQNIGFENGKLAIFLCIVNFYLMNLYGKSKKRRSIIHSRLFLLLLFRNILITSMMLWEGLQTSKNNIAKYQHSEQFQRFFIFYCERERK